MVTCLTEHAPAPDAFGIRCHSTVMARFARLLDGDPKKPLYLAEICAATGVSERTIGSAAMSIWVWARCAIYGCGECIWRAPRS